MSVYKQRERWRGEVEIKLLLLHNKQARCQKQLVSDMMREKGKTDPDSWTFSSVPCFVKLLSASVGSNVSLATSESR